MRLITPWILMLVLAQPTGWTVAADGGPAAPFASFSQTTSVEGGYQADADDPSDGPPAAIEGDDVVPTVIEKSGIDHYAIAATIDARQLAPTATAISPNLGTLAGRLACICTWLK